MSQRLLKFGIRENWANLDLSFIHVRGEVGHNDFLSQDIACRRARRRRGSSRAACGGLGSGLAGDCSLGSTSGATWTTGILLLLGNNLQKRSESAVVGTAVPYIVKRLVEDHRGCH